MQSVAGAMDSDKVGYWELVKNQPQDIGMKLEEPHPLPRDHTAGRYLQEHYELLNCPTAYTLAVVGTAATTDIP